MRNCEKTNLFRTSVDRKVGSEHTTHGGVTADLKWKAEEVAFFEAPVKGVCLRGNEHVN
jgi:hypothetical protein